MWAIHGRFINGWFARGRCTSGRCVRGCFARGLARVLALGFGERFACEAISGRLLERPIRGQSISKTFIIWKLRLFCESAGSGIWALHLSVISFVARLDLRRCLNSTQIGREEASPWPIST
jgi:hypothetical protein